MQTIFSTTRAADEAAVEVIEQMMDVDGADAYTVETVTNGSGRVVGREFHLTDEQAEFLAGALAQVEQAEDEAL